VRRNCNKILTELKEPNYLPKKLAKAMSVMNLYQKQKSGSMDISQSEFFPFPKETLSKQNDILNAIWSVQKLRHDKLKLVRPILDQDSMLQKMHFKVALRNYLTECLFECDEADLSDEALRTIAFINQISRHQFINRISRHQRAVFTEEKMEVEVDAVLNLSSHLKALAHYCTAECSCDEEFVMLGNDSCNDGNDFVLLETNYLKLSLEQQLVPEPCCSNNISDTDVMRECFGGSTVVATHSVSRSEDPGSNSAGLLKKPCERSEDPACSGMEPDTRSGDGNHLKKSRCSEINEIRDETSILAHKLIGHMLDTWLFVEDNGLDELFGERLGGGLVSQGSTRGTLEFH
jgi:phage FluMu protein Com